MPGPYDHFFNPALMGGAHGINKSTHPRSFTLCPSNPYQNPRIHQFIPALTTTNMATGYSSWGRYDSMPAPKFPSQSLPTIETQDLDLAQYKPNGEILGKRPLDLWKQEAELRSKTLGGEKVTLANVLAFRHVKYMTNFRSSANNFHLSLQSGTSHSTSTEENKAKEYQQQLKLAQLDFIAALSIQEIKRMQIFEQQQSGNTSSDTIDGKVTGSKVNRRNTSAYEMKSGMTTVYEPDQLRLWDELVDDPERHLKSFTVSALDHFMQAQIQTHPEFAFRLADIFKTKSPELKGGNYLEREGQVEHEEEDGGVLLFYDPNLGTPQALWDISTVPLPPVGVNLGQTRLFRYVWMLANPPKTGLPEDDSNLRKEVLEIMSGMNGEKLKPTGVTSWNKVEVWANDNSGWY